MKMAELALFFSRNTKQQKRESLRSADVNTTQPQRRQGIQPIDDEVKSNSYHKHNYEAEKCSISKLAKELIEIWEQHGISKPRKAVEDKLRLRFIPRF